MPTRQRPTDVVIIGLGATGGVAALPIWISFMQKALKGVPEKPLQPPEGVISVRVSPETGLRDDTSNVSEFFFAEFPPAGSRSDGLVPTAPGRTTHDVRDQPLVAAAPVSPNL